MDRFVDVATHWKWLGSVIAVWLATMGYYWQRLFSMNREIGQRPSRAEIFDWLKRQQETHDKRMEEYDGKNTRQHEKLNQNVTRVHSRVDKLYDHLVGVDKLYDHLVGKAHNDTGGQHQRAHALRPGGDKCTENDDTDTPHG